MHGIKKPDPIAINPDNPFAADCLGLDAYAKSLNDLVAATTSSFVVNLEAPWGQGKSTFLEMWRHSLAANDIRSLCFNAWETDFFADPLVALIGELSAGMAELSIAEPSKAKQQLIRLRKIGARMAARSLPALVKAGTLGILDLNEVAEEAIAAAAEKIAEEEIKRYEQVKDSIEKFRSELSSFVEKIYGSDGSKKPLVIVIDELDRCRPDYAIRVLEVVKHLFSVQGVFFVIATDSRQLSNAIKHVYGLDSAAEDYLRRFFDLSLSLPEPSTKQFVDSLFSRYGLDEILIQRTHNEFQYDRRQAVSSFVAMFDSTECSLRDQEKCFMLFSLSMRGIGNEAYIHPLLLCPLIVLRVKRRSLYEKFVRGDVDATELVDSLKVSAVAKSYFESDRGYGNVMYAYLIAATKGRSKRDFVLKNLRDLSNDESSGDEARQAARVLEIYSHYSFRNSTVAMRYVLPRIEFFARSDSDISWDD